MKSRTEIGIAGGGLLGRLCAWRLAQAGNRVTLIERCSWSAPAAAGWTAAGMLSPYSELTPADQAICIRGLESLALWPVWLNELEQETGVRVPFSQRGTVVVAHTRDRAELRHFTRQIRHGLQTLQQTRAKESGAGINLPGLPESVMQQLDQAALQTLEPSLADSFREGCFLPQEGQIDNRALFDALYLRLRDDPAVVLRSQESVSACQSRVVQTERGPESFDWVFDTRGTGARADIPGLRGVRGEILIVESRELTLQRPVRLMHPRYRIYIVPRGSGRLVIGATEIEAEDYSPISLRSTLELASALYAINPALAEARVIETASNCRPAMPDNLPLIQQEQGLTRLNGLYRHGFLLAPWLVRRAVRELTEPTRTLCDEAI